MNRDVPNIHTYLLLSRPTELGARNISEKGFCLCACWFGGLQELSGLRITIKLLLIIISEFIGLIGLRSVVCNKLQGCGAYQVHIV